MDFFRNSSDEDPTFFDEGPIVRARAVQAVNSSSIDTGPINAYRQGVSLTQQSHFDAGLVKIHAGEPGHILRRNRYGMDKNFRQDAFFEELDYFDSEAFLRAQELIEPLFFNIFTFPIITGDNDQIENFTFDGIIEPFPIREVASFFSIEAPFQSRDIRASLMCGNLDPNFGCEMVKTVDEFKEKTKLGAFLDLIDMFGIYSTVGFFTYDFETISPFADDRRPRGVPVSVYQGTDIVNALSPMSGSTENYVRPEEWSATSGFVYENNRFPGTDSLAFGGMTH
jgi:hypothetical protein